MSDRLPDSYQQEGVASPGKKGRFKRFKDRIGRGSQPDGRRLFSHPQSPFRPSGRAKSPDTKNESKVESVKLNHNIQASTTTLTTTAKVELKGSADDNLPMKKAIADLDKEYDLWILADQQLRNDHDKREIMKKYDRILEQNLGSELKPAGTSERRKQLLKFLDLKTNQLKDAANQTRLDDCSRKAKRFFRNAVDCVVATQCLINNAVAPCLPASVACAGVTFLLSVSLII